MTLAELVRGTGIELSIGWVQQVDLRARTVLLDERVMSWDRLVLALGASRYTNT